MSTFLKAYGTVEGPLGFPMQEAAARALDAELKSLPEPSYRKALVTEATSEVLPGERADVSWISVESIDRDREIVRAAGMEDRHFAANPLVTLNHNYHEPPIGRSAWRKRVTSGSRPGVKAKTIYPARPPDWPEGQWRPDNVLCLVQSGLLRGKSIGFVPLSYHQPTPEEILKAPQLADVYRIIDKWLLLEYACCWLPANQEALVEQVSKHQTLSPETLRSLEQLFGLVLPAAIPPRSGPPPEATVIGHTPLAEVEKALARQLAVLDLPAIAGKIAADVLERLRGRV